MTAPVLHTPHCTKHLITAEVAGSLFSASAAQLSGGVQIKTKYFSRTLCRMVLLLSRGDPVQKFIVSRFTEKCEDDINTSFDM